MVLRLDRADIERDAGPMRVLQVTSAILPQQTLWCDVMEVPPSINNLAVFLEAAKQSFDGRSVRIIDILEGATDDGLRR